MALMKAAGLPKESPKVDIGLFFISHVRLVIVL